MISPKQIMQLKPNLDAFSRNHPGVMNFFVAVKDNVREGSVFDITVTTPEGKTMTTNMRVTAEDLELLAMISELK